MTETVEEFMARGGAISTIDSGQVKRDHSLPCTFNGETFRKIAKTTLTDSQINNIVDSYKAGESIRNLAEKYNRRDSTISNLIAARKAGLV